MKKLYILFFINSLLILSTLFFAESITLIDMMGREIEVPTKIDRIVATYKPATQFIFALNAQEKLVGVDDGSFTEKLFIALYPKITELPKVGSKKNGINIETVASLHPDIVILFPHNQAEETAAILEKMNISTIIINPESLEEIRETNLLLGEVLGLQEKSNIIDQQFEYILNLLERTKSLPMEKRKVVYFANSELLDTVGKGMLQNDLIEWAGGINPVAESKSGFVKISPEQLIAWNPEVIVTSQLFQGDISALLNEKKYQGIKAFQNNEIYRFPSKLEPWDFPNPSSYLAMLWLAMKLYPDLFTDVDFIKIADDFYYTLYGLNYTDLLNLVEN